MNLSCAIHVKLEVEKELPLERVDGRKRNVELEQIVADFNANWSSAAEDA